MGRQEFRVDSQVLAPQNIIWDDGCTLVASIRRGILKKNSNYWMKQDFHGRRVTTAKCNISQMNRKSRSLRRPSPEREKEKWDASYGRKRRVDTTQIR